MRNTGKNVVIGSDAGIVTSVLGALFITFGVLFVFIVNGVLAPSLYEATSGIIPEGGSELIVNFTEYNCTIDDWPNATSVPTVKDCDCGCEDAEYRLNITLLNYSLTEYNCTVLDWRNATLYEPNETCDCGCEDAESSFGVVVENCTEWGEGGPGDWLAGYDYRMPINISGGSGAGTYYQVNFSIGSSSGGNFDFGGNSADFPDDIRFTDNDGVTELDYWVENLTEDPISVWVEVSDNLNSSVDIYCYYGKADDTTASNGTNTFLLFDDFDDGNYNGWIRTNTNTVNSLFIDQWYRVQDAPYLMGTAGQWDASGLENPEVYYNASDSLYYLFYEACEGMSGYKYKIGVATSPNATGPFNKSLSNPIIDPIAKEGEGGNSGIQGPAIVKVGDIYYFFGGHQDSGGSWDDTYRYVGNNLTNFTMDGIPLTHGSFGTWDSDSAIDPNIMYDPDISKYIMVYSGASTAGGGADWQVGLATATNITDNFTKSPYNPIIATNFTLGFELPNNPMIMKRDGVYIVYFCLVGWGADKKGVYYATSPNLDNWTINCEPIYTPIGKGGQMGPFVLNDSTNGRYILYHAQRNVTDNKYEISLAFEKTNYDLHGHTASANDVTDTLEITGYRGDTYTNFSYDGIFKYNPDNYSSGDWGGIVFKRSSNNTFYIVWFDATNSYWSKEISGIRTFTTFADAKLPNTYYDFEINVFGDLVLFYRDGTYIWNKTDSSIAGGNVGIGGHGDTNNRDIVVDDVRVRKFTLPEPLFAGAGSEEEKPLGGDPECLHWNNVSYGTICFDGFHTPAPEEPDQTAWFTSDCEEYHNESSVICFDEYHTPAPEAPNQTAWFSSECYDNYTITISSPGQEMREEAMESMRDIGNLIGLAMTLLGIIFITSEMWGSLGRLFSGGMRLRRGRF